MPPVGFEPTISAGERPQTYVLDHAATGTGSFHDYITKFCRQQAEVLRNHTNENISNTEQDKTDKGWGQAYDLSSD